MNIKLVLISTILVLFVFVDIGDGTPGRRRTGSSGWRSGSGSRWSTSRPRYSQTSNQAATHKDVNSQFLQAEGGGAKRPNSGSQPGKVGWNVPDKKPTGTNTNPNTPVKASAPPVNEHSVKTSATNVQSSAPYSPSGGYPRQPASNPYQTNSNPHQPYNPSPPASQAYNPPLSHGYNPPPGPGYYNPGVGGHAPYGAQPSYGGGYNPGFGQPSFGQSFSPSMGQPQQTILVQQASKPGIGQLAKEALVFAGVNAAVNRIIPGGIYGTRSSGGGEGGGGGGGVTHTQITYNNYYNNGTAVNPEQPAAAAAPVAPVAAAAAAPAPAAQPAAPAAQPAAPAPQPAANADVPGVEPLAQPQSNAGTNNAPQNNGNNQANNPNPLGFVTSTDDIKKLTESLFEKDQNSAMKYITMNVQGQKKDDSTTDDAPEPLLSVKDEAYEIPTVKAVLALHDNYEFDVKVKETVTAEEREENSALLDKILDTEVMKTTMKFLAEKGYIEDDRYEFKDILKRIWFSQFKRIDGDASSSGFETVFLAERFDSDIIGLHNWIYYAKQEAEKKLDYLGYIKEVKLGDKGAIVKVRSKLDGIVQPVTTVFVGTSPEVEFALYTICFFTRLNNACPISMGGTEFMLYVSGVNYFGKDILISGYPDI